MSGQLLRRLTPEQAASRIRRRDPVDAAALEAARVIVEDVRVRGEPAVREHARRLRDIEGDEPLVLGPDDLRAALESVGPEVRGVLERTASRIRAFAEAQRASLTEVQTPIPGGACGQSVAPVERAGCYAPGGRFPLPSSVLMTAVTARVAGVREVWVASPRPAIATLAAAAVAGADALLRVGGAQAVAALAFGAGPVAPCDVIVGPGNRFVTAAKQVVAGRVGIDMLAGPSELVVLADGTADPATVAADLLAQAEHDPDATPVLISTSGPLIDAVERELASQLESLPTRDTAERAVRGNGFAVLASGLDEGAALCDRLAPEHLEILCADAGAAASRVSHFGGLFIGAGAAEVLGDYGAGPNHTLPTGGTARFTGGLSVHHFLRIRTWLRIDDPAAARNLVDDAVALARIEGLEAHARSAARRNARRNATGE
jgi:phosphoribosyl-ATP pyrophosphohydrolase/phosphoribosyl-AMP cyclohydrolase/histidinol dehydrogenase